jgi:hypothetical protein
MDFLILEDKDNSSWNHLPKNSGFYIPEDLDLQKKKDVRSSDFSSGLVLRAATSSISLNIITLIKKLAQSL